MKTNKIMYIVICILMIVTVFPAVGLPIQTGDIPVIEENYTPPAGNEEDQKTVSFEDNKAEEIDIKDIPF